MAGKTSRTHGIVCWRCDYKFEVSVSLPKNAKKKGKVYSKWDSVRKCGECGASTRLRLGYTKKQGVYVDYEDPIKEEDEFEPEASTNRDKIGSYFSRNYERGKRLPLPKGAAPCESPRILRDVYIEAPRLGRGEPTPSTRH